jgi:hypothetical protein
MQRRKARVDNSGGLSGSVHLDASNGLNIVECLREIHI